MKIIENILRFLALVLLITGIIIGITNYGFFTAVGWIIAFILFIINCLMQDTVRHQSKLIKDLCDLTDNLTKEYLKNQKRV